MADLLQDIGYTIRVLRRSPGFTAAIVLSLGLGIGANTAIFTLLDAVMWRMLPVRDPESLLVLGRSRAGVTQHGFTYPQFKAMADRSDMAELAAYSSAEFPVHVTVAVNGQPEPSIEAQLVSGGYFRLLGVLPAAGRLIGPDDDRVPGGHAVAVISDGYWNRRFARYPSALGSVISLSGTSFTIVGVTPPQFAGVEVGLAPDIFVPVMMQANVMPVVGDLIVEPSVNRTWLQTLARLKPGVSMAQAVAALDVIHQQRPMPIPPALLARLGPEHVVTGSAANGISGLRQRFSASLFILMGVVALVLLVGCANTANLMLARAVARRPEFSLRLALGASRARLLRQVLVEGVVLSTIGGVVGLFVAAVATRLLLTYASAGRSPITLDLAPDARVLAFTAAISIATGVLFGLAPALRVARIDLISAMYGFRDVSPTVGGIRPGRMLAIAQVALSLIVLVAAGLFVESLRNLDAQDPSIPRDSVLVVRVEPTGSNQRNPPGVAARLDRQYRDLMARVTALPGVRSVSMSNVSPTKPESGAGSPYIDPQSGEQRRVMMQTVYAGYFSTLGLRFTRGRDFTDAEQALPTASACIVNEAYARTAYPGQDPIGRTCLQTPRTGPVSIIGVVEDARYTNLRQPAQPVAYVPFMSANTGRGQMILYVRVSGAIDAIAQRVRDEVWTTDRSVPQFEVRTLADEVDAALVQERLLATVSGFFGALTLVLTAIGLHGLLAFLVVQRTRELAIRMALGAQRRAVVWLVTREALVLVAIGALVAVPAALAAGRIFSTFLQGVLFGLTPNDPMNVLAAVGVIAAVGALAASLPARRASGVDPMSGLRSE
jgi:predicted permease